MTSAVKPVRSSSKQLGPEVHRPSRGLASGPKQVQTSLEQREAALQKVSQLMNPKDQEVGTELMEAPYAQELQQLMGSEVNNKEISAWIKSKCSEMGSPQFSRNVTVIVARASVTGLGSSAIFDRDLFERRLEIVKEIHNSEHGVEVLNGLQMAVAQLSHPPKLLGDMFDIVYNTEVVSEDDLKNWRECGTELFGRVDALISVKSFFEWLDSF